MGHRTQFDRRRILGIVGRRRRRRALPWRSQWWSFEQVRAERHHPWRSPDGSGFQPHLGFRGVVRYSDPFSPILLRLASQGKLNAPWAMVLSPTNFGDFSSDLLVGNFGDGRINAFDPSSGASLGTLGASDKTIAIDGLWGLAFGNGSTAGDTTTL